MKNMFIVAGQLTKKQTKGGVPGLAVEVIVENEVYDSTVTSEDGHFELALSKEELPKLFKAKSSATIQFRDRNGRLVHRYPERLEIRSNGAEKIAVAISDNDLKDHLDRPLIFRDANVFEPARRLGQLRRATQLFQGGPFERFQKMFPCIEPPLGRFKTLVDDAIATLDGDPLAADRFRDVLDELIQTEGRTQSYSEINRLVTTRGNPHAFASRQTPRPAYSSEPVVDRETGSLLLVAAMEAAAGDQDLAEHYVSVVTHQLSAYQRLSPLQRAGERALRGDVRGIKHFDDMLGAFERFCDPTIPNPDDVIIWEPDVLECSYEGLDALTKSGITYQIASVRPPSACAGETITINGQNFGSGSSFSGLVPNTVRFTREAGQEQTSYIDVVPDSWSNTRIEVTVPDSAIRGPLSLRIRDRTVRICDWIHTQYRRGNNYNFIGGSIIIDAFQANGQSEEVVVEPNETVDFTWLVRGGATSIRLEIQEIDGGSPPIRPEYDNLDQDGSRSVDVRADIADIVGTRQYECRLSASGRCGTVTETIRLVVHKRAQVFMTDMEITQAIQFLRADEHMVASSAVRPDNSVALIQNKATLVRVYFATDQDPTFNNGSVSGVTVRLRGFSGGEELVGSPLTPLNAALVAQVDNSVDGQRGNIARSANFRLPDTWTALPGQLRLEATISLSEESFDSVDPLRSRFFLESLRFHPARPLNCMIVLVNYTGPQAPEPPLGPPTRASAVRTISSSVRRMYPTARIRFSVPPFDSVIEVKTPLTIKDSLGVLGWRHVLNEMQVRSALIAGDQNIIWCGVAHPGIPIIDDPEDNDYPKVASGRSTRDTAAVFALGFATFRALIDAAIPWAIGRALGRPIHERDPGWAAEGIANPLHPDDLGEFGVDVEALFFGGGAGPIVRSPGTIELMSSELPPRSWISPYTYKKLMNDYFAPLAPPAEIVPGGTAALTSRRSASTLAWDHLIVRGVIQPHKNEVILEPLFHFPHFPKAQRAIREDDYILALVDKSDRTLACIPIDLEDIRFQDELGKVLEGEVPFVATIPLDPSAVALEIWHNREKLARVARPKVKPNLSNVTLRKGRKMWALTWQASHENKTPLTYTVSATFDGGKRWHCLGHDLSKGKFTFDPKELPGGKKVKLRIYASDGFNTVSKDSDPFSLPLKPPEIILCNFEDGDNVTAGEAVLLEAVAISPQIGSLDPEKIEWRSDIQGVLGRGEQLWVVLEEGEHELTLCAEETPKCMSEYRVKVCAVKM